MQSGTLPLILYPVKGLPVNDRIHLIEARLSCKIGTSAEERSCAQDLILDVTLETDLRAAALSEDISDTINYCDVLTVLSDVAASREWVLIESLAESMCANVLAQFPAESVRILLRKPAALRDRDVRTAAIELERHR